MNLKDLFATAEDGRLTYDQFEKALEASQIKLANLAEGGYVAKQKYTDELAARDTRITDLTTLISQRDADLTTLKQQLDAAGTDSAKLRELNTQFTDLQTKYDKDTKAYQRQLAEQARQFAITEYANGLNFTSGAAKREYIRAMSEKKFELDNGKLLGISDATDAYRQDNADSFVAKPAVEPVAKPQFAKGTNDDGGQASSNPIQFKFIGVRPHD